MAGSGMAACPWAGVFAQSGAALLRAPKQALVIGNSKYQHAPLRNPVNDARGMAEALRSAGFGVTLGLELTQAGIREAIRAHGDNLARTKAVGLFYFAGHGAQLAWRNYLIPVDADIINVEELREQGVDVNSLIEGIRKARNPMNLIILDACRDNPFGSSARLDQKGLSQLDAPPGTLLAYATAPGNTAIDGEGENGLYTEHLLREIKVPEAKVEDVFKRVRLAVRRRSKGLQIPWESTSLEEDFWFIPPTALKKLAEEEVEREFQLEAALWENIKAAVRPEPLEDYLRRYPNGRFSELAQVQLDQVLARMGEKKVEVVSAPANPYSKGTAKANMAYAVGDQYTYRNIDLFTKLETGRRTLRVTEVGNDQVIFNGMLVSDLLGNLIVSKRQRVFSTARQYYVSEYSVGKKWTTRFEGIGFNDEKLSYEYDFKVVAKEEKTVPAGTFDAYKVEGLGYSSANATLHYVYWIAPDRVRKPVAIERLNRNRSGRVYVSEGDELVSYTQNR
jgi:uncharacterized caspase-like protein